MSVNSPMFKNYGVPDSNPGSEFARDAYKAAPQGPKVRPYAQETRTTSGQATTWDNQNPGVVGSFQKFDSAPTMAQPTPGA
jgi:hypothetical protein